MFNKSKSLQSWSFSVSVGRIMAQSNLILAIAILGLTYAVLTKDKTVVVVPPVFTEEITMIGNTASEPFKTGWALFAANMAGNISEKNSKFVTDTLRKMFYAKDADSYEKQLLSQVEALKIRSVKETFTPLDLIYNSEVDTTWVYGDKKTVSNRSGATSVQKWTYEIQIKASSGYPKIIHFTQYAGAPNTRKRLDGLKKIDAENKKIDAENKAEAK